jgi:hypothetical protein
VKITAQDARETVRVEVRTVKKVAPCGCCGKTVDRDSMWAVNTLFAAPDDAEKIRVRVRACGDCAKDLIQAQRDMEWDNASMTSV